MNTNSRLAVVMRCCWRAVVRVTTMVAMISLLESPSLAANWADDCTDVCGTVTGACTVSAAWDIVPGSVINCAGRDVSFDVGGWMRVTDGDMTLLARNLTAAGGSAGSGGLQALQDEDERAGSVVIRLSGDMNLHGAIRANGNGGGGRIDILASGNVTIHEAGTDGLEADGTGQGADGGQIRVEAGGSIWVYDPIHTAGAGAGDSAGGEIELIAGGAFTSAQHGHINAPGRAGGAGNIEITSRTGNVIIGEHLEVDGKGEVAPGGTIKLHANGQVQINQQIYARGGYTSGGGEAAGGSVEIDSGCAGVTLGASVFVYGGQAGSRYEGGSIRVDSSGDIAVSAGVVLDARAVASGGDGGTIVLRARNLVQLSSTSTLDARGSTAAPGTGGSIHLEACSVSVPSGAVVDVTGNAGGTVMLGASRTPPTSGTQPLVVGTAASLRANGSDTTKPGLIQAMPLQLRQGTCSNDGNLRCFLNSDCTVGCQTGTCAAANPDTGGVNTQFDVLPVRSERSSLHACIATCVP